MPHRQTPVAWGGGSVVVDLMFDVLPIGCGGPGFGSCAKLFIYILVLIIMFYSNTSPVEPTVTNCNKSDNNSQLKCVIADVTGKWRHLWR